jgi:thiamine-phosphate pyrophosphorylase
VPSAGLDTPAARRQDAGQAAMTLPVVHLITDRTLVPELGAHLGAVLRGLEAGRVAVHLREKSLSGAALLALGRELVEVCHAHGQRLLVNERIDVALACGADGVHLPATAVGPAAARRLLGPSALVGVSCHSADEVERARAGGADYASFGPVWATPSKAGHGAPVGLERLREASRLGLPLLALGGVEPALVGQAFEAGAAGVAVIRAWLDGPAPAAAVRALLASAP